MTVLAILAASWIVILMLVIITVLAFWFISWIMVKAQRNMEQIPSRKKGNNNVDTDNYTYHA